MKNVAQTLLSLSSLASISFGLALAGCGGESREDRIARAVERGEQGIVTLQTHLLETLTSALEEGGPVGAVRVCRDAAETITRDAAESEGIALGRTSHRLRDPENAPPEWARSIVAESAGMRAENAEPRDIDLGERVGLLRPIGTLGMCARCHGEDLGEELEAKLDELYPEDRATGFEVGELRGWAWAEVPLR